MMTDLPLPLPIPLAVAKVALVAAFLLHIVFVNLTVGGTLIALSAHWRGRRDPDLLELARRIIDGVTVHKSVAVVLGVGPLLLISIAYTTPFYTSSTLVAPAWLSVIWLVTLAFGLLYAYKFGWNTLRAARPWLHACFGLGAGAVLLVVPLIYLTNTQLMLQPAVWARHPGFFEAMFTVGNVLPRYVHFLLASLAIAGFWVALWYRRPCGELPDDVRQKFVRQGTLWALTATSLQFLAGPLVLFTLPTGAVTPLLLVALAVGILAGALALFALADSLRGNDRVPRAAALVLVTVICMGTARHLIREALLHRTGEYFKGAQTHVKLSSVNLCNDSQQGEDVYGHQPRSGRDAA